MNKILDFFQEELSSCNEDKNRIESDNHRASLDIEVIAKTKEKMVSEFDNTHNVFSTNEGESAFNNREVDLLNKREDELKKIITTQSSELKQIENRICSINDLIAECDNIEIEENQKISGLDILEIQENDRQRIARDIHDSVVQKMTALIHKSEFTMKVIDTDPVRAKLEMEVINKVVRECIGELRGIIFNLRPMSFDDLGLEVTLRRVVAQMNSITDMDINLSYLTEDIVEIKPIISISVLRIIEELCSNAIKYSHGTQINIRIKTNEKVIIIDFDDNGIGFENFDVSDSKNDNTGFGIPFLKERVRLLGGLIKIDNGNDNNGIRYYIEIPCHNEEK